MVKVNGVEREISEMILGEFLLEERYDLRRIAVELNGEIVPKIQYDNIILHDGDCIEVVSFVGGG